MVLKNTLERPLDSKEFKPVNPKGNQLWIFIGGLVLKLKLQYFCIWCKGQLFGKDPDADAGEGNGNPLQYSCLENAMDRGSWKATVHGVTKSWTQLAAFGEGNGTPLQYSCLENPMDRGAWWAAIYGVAQSRTRLNWLSSSSTCIDIKRV